MKSKAEEAKSMSLSKIKSAPTQKAEPSPPYRFGSSWASMVGKRACLMARWPDPTMDIFARVLAEMRGLNIQNIQLSRVGTLTKNFRYWENITMCSQSGSSEAWNYMIERDSLGAQGSGFGKCWSLQRRHFWNLHLGWLDWHLHSLPKKKNLREQSDAQ